MPRKLSDAVDVNEAVSMDPVEEQADAVEMNEDMAEQEEMPAEEAETAVAPEAEPEAAEEAAPAAEPAQKAEKAPAEEAAPAPRPARRRRKSTKTIEEAVSEMTEKTDAVIRADRDERRSLYQRERVFSSDSDAPAMTRAAEQRNTYLDLASSANTGKVLSGTLMGVDELEISGGKRIVCGVIYYKDFRVYIPQEMLFVMDEEYDSPKARNDAQKYYTSMRLDSEVTFVVTQVSESDKFAFASHLAAVQQKVAENYFTKNRYGKSLVRENGLAEAIVTYVTGSSIGVEIGGMETRIPAEDLSWLYVNNAKVEGYTVGEKILVMVKKISPMTYRFYSPFGNGNAITYNLVAVEASVKEAQENPNDKYYSFFHEGQRVRARITGRSDKGYFARIAELRDALCQDDIDERLPDGTIVSVKIMKMRPDTKNIYARIIDVIKLPD